MWIRAVEFLQAYTIIVWALERFLHGRLNVALRYRSRLCLTVKVFTPW